MAGDRDYGTGGDPGLPRGVVIMSERRGWRLTGRLLAGLVLVSLGVLWTLDNLGFIEAREFLQFWPLLLVGYGLVRMTGLDGIRRVTSGSLFILAGGWLMARELGFVHVSIFSLWPVFMILIGATLVWRSMRGPVFTGEAADHGRYPRPFAFMGGVTRRVESQELEGLEATAVMGGVEVDLTGARAKDRTVVAEVFACWGGIELIVPEGWRVSSEVTPIMGGVDDTSRTTTGEDGTTLIVRGVVIMGGVEIKNTKDGRRFRGFRMAEGVRVGVISGSGRTRKEVRVDASGVTITRTPVEEPGRGPAPPPTPGAPPEPDPAPPGAPPTG